MYEYLQKLFGKTSDGQPESLTWEQLQAKISADKDLKLVNLADGGYVSKDKFDAKETELSGIKTQLTEANKTIDSYKTMDIEGIKKSAADWETKYKADTKTLQDKLDAQARQYTEDIFVNGYKFTSKAARAGVLAEVRGKHFEIKDGVLMGAKEYMDGLQKDEEYKGAFVIDKPADDNGGKETKPRFASGTQKTGDEGGKKYTPPLVF